MIPILLVLSALSLQPFTTPWYYHISPSFFLFKSLGLSQFSPSKPPRCSSRTFRQMPSLLCEREWHRPILWGRGWSVATCKIVRNNWGSLKNFFSSETLLQYYSSPLWPANMYFASVLTGSQNCWDWRQLWRSPSPPLLLTTDSTTVSWEQSSWILDYLRGWRLHSVSGNQFLCSNTLTVEITTSLSLSSLFLPSTIYTHQLIRFNSKNLSVFYLLPMSFSLLWSAKQISVLVSCQGNTQQTTTQVCPSICSRSDHICMTKPCCTSQ